MGIDAEALARVDDVMATAIADGALPGGVVLVAKDGAIVWRKAYGHRAVAPEPVAMTVDTVFDVASLTKVMATATSIMLLSQRGHLSLSAHVTGHIPQYGQAQKGSTRLEHLLTHTAGLRPGTPLKEYRRGTASAIEHICTLPIEDEVGTRFRYSDVGYVVLGGIVERVSGKPLDVYAREEIFGPLEMSHTTFKPPAAWRERIAPQNQRNGEWIIGDAHDPRAHRLGGVAGHAGLFSTADDVARFCQMILNEGRIPGTSKQLLTPAHVHAMIQIPAGATHGRGMGFDVDTVYSSPRGHVFPIGTSFGHTGFTGTSLWISPPDNMFVILLSNRLHPDGKGHVVGLRRKLATTIATSIRRKVLTGLDVLARDDFDLLAKQKVGVITNHTGRDSEGRSVVTLLHDAPDVALTAIFSPEHGYRGQADGEVSDARDEATGVPIFSLYGETRRPTSAMLAGIDTLVFDIQDIGTRFYTYITTMGYAMEAAAEHGIRFVVLDRPNPIGGLRPAGPLADADKLGFTAYHPLPVRHGMTIGELAGLFNTERKIGVDLHVVKVEDWRRGMLFDATGLTWVNPSPNMRSLDAAILYPGIGLLEMTNLSVGRGTERPFEQFGAPWIDGPALADALNELALPGVHFAATRFTPTASRYAGETCHGVEIKLTDRYAYAPARTGLAIARTLKKQYGEKWDHENVRRLLANDAAMHAWQQAATLDELVDTWADQLASFERVRKQYLLYD